jgi:hypothetical protein
MGLGLGLLFRLLGMHTAGGGSRVGGFDRWVWGRQAFADRQTDRQMDGQTRLGGRQRKEHGVAVRPVAAPQPQAPGGLGGLVAALRQPRQHVERQRASPLPALHHEAQAWAEHQIGSECPIVHVKYGQAYAIQSEEPWSGDTAPPPGLLL